MSNITEHTSNNPSFIDGIRYNLLGFELTKFENFQIEIQDEIFENLTIQSQIYEKSKIIHTIDIKFTSDFTNKIRLDIKEKNISLDMRYNKKELFNIFKSNYDMENIEDVILSYLFYIFREQKISYTYINIEFKDFSYTLYDSFYTRTSLCIYKVEKGIFNLKDNIHNNYLEFTNILQIKSDVFKYMKLYEYLKEICSKDIFQEDKAQVQANVTIVMLYLREKKKFDFIYFTYSTKDNDRYEDIFTYLRNQIGHPTVRTETSHISQIERIITDKLLENIIEVIVYLQNCAHIIKDEIKKEFQNIKKNIYIQNVINGFQEIK